MNKLRVLELFGGIGACSKALERLGIDYEFSTELKEKDIKSIVTKEQFESMEYKVGD